MRKIATTLLRFATACLPALTMGCDSGTIQQGHVKRSCLDAFIDTSLARSRVPTLDDHDFIGGVARVPGGFVNLDLRAGQVVLFDGTGASRRVFGRTGQGPLEFQPFALSERLLIRDARWIDARGTDLVVFDGRRLLFGDTTGFRHAVNIPTTVVSGFNQIHQIRWLDAERVVLAYERAPSWEAQGADRGSFEFLLVQRRSGDVTAWARFRTLPWPRNAMGRVGRGAAEAQPSVDMRGTCLVYADGHTDSLWIVDRARGDSLAMRIALPERFAEDMSADEYRRLGVPEGAILPIRHAARISRLAVDTGGRVWLRPSAPRYRGEVWRLDVGMQTVVSDTLITPFVMTPFQ